jgi:RNA polymerase sigma-70 factor (ECF subfamily)
MDEQDWLAGRFEEHRGHLRAVAYRMLGSLAEADDAVQESWLRLSRAGGSGIDNLGGWLTTVVGRVCLDMLRSRASRREEPAGPHLPDPVVGTDPEQQALLADSVGMALLVVLDTLDPAERLAFVLHDMFGLPFDEIAPVVGRSTVATRQLASRARRRVQGSPVPDTSLDRQRTVVDAFFAAATATSTPWWPSSTRTSSCAPRAACCRRARPGSCTAPPRWRTRPCCSAARAPARARAARWW